MTNISGNEKIRNAVVNLFTEKLNNDSAKAEEYATKYLSDNTIDENEFQELSAEFGEDFANEIKNTTGTTETTEANTTSTTSGKVRVIDVDGYDPNSPHTLPMQNYSAWADMIDESRIDVANPTSELEPKSTTTTNNSSSGTSGTSSSSNTSSGHALKIGDCQWDFEQAEKVHDAIDGACDDWDELQNILCNLSTTDLNRIMIAYETKYGKNMKKDIEAQTAGLGGWFTFGYGKKKDAVIAVLTKAEKAPNENGKKEKEEIKAYFNGERW